MSRDALPSHFVPSRAYLNDQSVFMLGLPTLSLGCLLSALILVALGEEPRLTCGL